MPDSAAAEAMADLNISDVTAPVSGGNYFRYGKGGLHLALDSGGTKVNAVLFDDGGHLKASARAGSLRANTTPAELIDAHFDEMIARLGLKSGARLESVSGNFEGALEERFRKWFSVGNIVRDGELELGLSGAGIFGDGLLALSGTGATVFARCGGKVYSAGGYGSAVSDEGSGYWISREAVGAAIRDYERRGPRTVLTGAIARHFGAAGRDELREAIFSIYSVKSPPVTQIAGLVPLTVDAAAGGDEISVSILKRAGELLAEQMIFLCEKYVPDETVPLTVCGSVWKKNPVFMNAFREKISGTMPRRPFVIPRFEPIAGAVLKYLHEAGRFGVSAENALTDPETEYGRFLFEI